MPRVVREAAVCLGCVPDGAPELSALEQQLFVGAIGGVIGAALTGGLTLLGIRLTLKNQREEERRKDARQLRDARRERLRLAIEPVLRVSLALGQVVRENQFLWQTETVEKRNERHSLMLREAWPGLNDARVALMVQADGRTLVEILDVTVMTGYQRYMTGLAMNKDHPGTVPHGEQAQQEKALIDGIEKLRAEAQRLLDELDKPI